MREHGVIHRLATVFEEVAIRLQAGDEVPAGVLLNSGVLVDEFVEAYHEELEERYVFPAFTEAGPLRELVRLLHGQHLVGRSVAQRIIFYAGKGDLLQSGVREPLQEACRAYARMYRAHAAREDTVLFPAFRRATAPERFRELGRKFRHFEGERLGEAGFAGEVQRVAEIEETLGIHELAEFTAEV